MQTADATTDANHRTGFSNGSVIYLNWEDATPLDGAGAPPEAARHRAYISAWADTVLKRSFYPGFYAHRKPWIGHAGSEWPPWLVEMTDENDHPSNPLNLANLPTVVLDKKHIAQQFIIECKFDGIDQPPQEDGKGGPST